jgi:hypothetical protein
MPTRLHALLLSVILALFCAAPRTATGTPDEALARACVFEVALTYGADNEVATPVQPGFLVRSRATGIVGVTSYMPLHGATSASARFAGSEGRYDLEILTAMPGRDVALVRLVPVSEQGQAPAPALSPEQFLDLAPGDLRAGQTVWSLQASRLTGEVRAAPGLLAIEDQGPRSSRRPFDAPGWLFAKENNRQHSGCPLVDERGRLVGINVWGWPGAGARPLGLTATTVDDLFGQYDQEQQRARNKGEELKPIRVRDARQKFAGLKRAGSVFPALHFSKPPGDPAVAKRLLLSLRDDLSCGMCTGTGQLTDKDGGKRPATRKEKCTQCKGAGVKDRDEFAKIARRAARALTSLPQGTDEFDKVVDAFSDGVGTLVERRPPEFATRLREVGRAWFDPDRAERGDAVMFIGSIAGDGALGDWEKDVVVVELTDTKVRALAVAPEDSKLGKKGSALIAGVVAGFITGADGTPWIVLERVTAVPYSRRG